jgi:hypothetical protein
MEPDLKVLWWQLRVEGVELRTGVVSAPQSTLRACYIFLISGRIYDQKYTKTLKMQEAGFTDLHKILQYDTHYLSHFQYHSQPRKILPSFFHFKPFHFRINKQWIKGLEVRRPYPAVILPSSTQLTHSHINSLHSSSIHPKYNTIYSYDSPPPSSSPSPVAETTLRPA